MVPAVCLSDSTTSRHAAHCRRAAEPTMKNRHLAAPTALLITPLGGATVLCAVDITAVAGSAPSLR
jgi:hypothetical protein